MAQQIPCSATIQQIENEVTNLRNSSSDLTDAAAKQAVAHRYGFSTWRHLEVYLFALANDASREPEFLQAACLSYLSNWLDPDHARTMLASDPTISSRDIFQAAAVGEVEVVRELVESDRSIVNTRGGFFGWEPLMYACYSRLNLPDKSTVEVARILIANGADPNAFFMWGGQYRFTALTGVFGEGEEGPTRAPEHAHCEIMARLLLNAGANPNDGQALYNRMFTNGHTCLQLLLEFGISENDKCNWWLEEAGELTEHPDQTLRYQLNWAVKNGHTERAKLLIDHGADLATRPGEKSLYEAAMLVGEEELANYLAAKGAEKTELDAVSRLAAACMNGNELVARSLLAETPDLMERLQSARPEFVGQAAAGNRVEALRLIAKLGGDLNNRSSVGPLHEAAWAGSLAAIKALVELGADVTARDKRYHATPLQWAIHNGGHPDVVDFLSTCDIDIFDAVATDNVGRIEAILQADPKQLEVTLGEASNFNCERENKWQTPLAAAVTRNRADCVRLLLDRGANVSIVDDNGRRLSDIAKECAFSEVIAQLDSQKG